MASVFADITDNIVTTLSGQNITLNGTSRRMTWETERFVNVGANRFPFGIVAGPAIEVVGRGHGVMNCEVHYLLNLADYTIDDEYSPTATIQPIASVTKDVIADIVKLLMVDQTRGGRARKTDFEAGGYYFDDDNDTPMFHVYLKIMVKTMVRESDPYYTGG